MQNIILLAAICLANSKALEIDSTTGTEHHLTEDTPTSVAFKDVVPPKEKKSMSQNDRMMQSIKQQVEGLASGDLKKGESDQLLQSIKRQVDGLASGQAVTEEIPTIKKAIDQDRNMISRPIGPRPTSIHPPGQIVQKDAMVHDAKPTEDFDKLTDTFDFVPTEMPSKKDKKLDSQTTINEELRPLAPKETEKIETVKEPIDVKRTLQHRPTRPDPRPLITDRVITDRPPVITDRVIDRPTLPYRPPVITGDRPPVIIGSKDAIFFEMNEIKEELATITRNHERQNAVFAGFEQLLSLYNEDEL